MATPRAVLAVLVCLPVVLAACSTGPSLFEQRPPPALTALWHGPDGRAAEAADGRASDFEVASDVGPAHCDWESVVFLRVAWPLGSTYTIKDPPPVREYVRDPGNALGGAADLLGTFDGDAVLPEDAESTGYRNEQGVELWFGDDGGDTYAYVVEGDRTERWPRAREGVACA